MTGSIQTAIDKLKAIDTNDILSFGTKSYISKTVDIAKFQICGTEYHVEIMERIAPSKHIGRSKPKSKGVQYLICNDLTNYSKRWYKNPNTVIEKIEQFEAKAQMKKKQEDQQTVVLDLLKDAFPNANIYTFPGYQTKFEISTVKGQVVVYTHIADNGSLELTVHSASPKGETLKQVADSILS